MKKPQHQESPDTTVFPTEDEWQNAARLSSKPVCYNFLVMPMVPEDAATLLDSNGEPVIANYLNIDWKAAAKNFQEMLDGYVPKSIKVFVANDGPDLFDINEFSPHQPNRPAQENGFVYRTADALRSVTMRSYRAGVLSMPEEGGLHLNDAIGGYGRPPLAGMVVGIKFNNMMQSCDYLSSTTELLFGEAFAMPIEPISLPAGGTSTHGKLPGKIHAWLEEQFGAVYSDKSGALFLSATFSE